MSEINKNQKIIVHHKRTKLYLQNIPEWLFLSKYGKKHNGILIKRWRMNNWDKFILYFDSNAKESFSNLVNIEVCNLSLHLNYKPREFCITSFEELKPQLDSLQKKEQEMRTKLIKNLEQLGFQFRKNQPN